MSRPKNIEELFDLVAEKIPPLARFMVKDPGTEKFDPEVLAATAPLQELAKSYFDIEIEGMENIREGGGLLAGNHGRTGFDAMIFPAVLAGALGRPVRALADKMWFRLPKIRDWMAALGAVPGTRENAVRLLKEGYLVLVYPGGANEVMKPAHEAYQLRWGNRTGFVRVAMDADVPIYPFAGIGVEELFRNLPGWDAVEQSRLAQWIEESIGRRYRGMPPVVGAGPLPAPVDLTFKIGAPLTVSGIAGEAEVFARAKAVQRAVQRLIEEGAAER